MKRLLIIQDISCLGKCSLTMALPVISALGSEAVILPTALLSSHTMFSDFTVKDLSDQIGPITQQWKSQDVKFDAIYTGYLGTAEQIDQVKEIFRTFRGEDTFIFVDPVMADFGKLYPTFDMDYVGKNMELCAAADIIVPNITEGSLMTGMEYREDHDEAYIKEMLGRLSELGAPVCVLTGVSLKKGMTGVMGYDRRTDEYYLYQTEKVDAAFRGIQNFGASLLRKTSQISLNPMEYVDKKIVAYKNPTHENFATPYITSEYSGMMFNSYC